MPRHSNSSKSRGNGPVAAHNGTHSRTPRDSRAGQAFGLDCGLEGPLQIEVRDEAGRTVAEVLVHKPFAFIGRDSRADVRLDSPAVKRWHAFVQELDGQLFVLDLARTGGITSTAGPISWESIPAGDELHIGGYQIRIIPPRRASADETTPTSGVNALEVHFPAGEKRVAAVSEPVTLVGSASRCLLRAVAPGVGPYQFALVASRPGMWLVDLRGGRATRVNEKPVRFARLKDGDLIQAGEWTAVACSRDMSNERLRIDDRQNTPVQAVTYTPEQLMGQLQQCLLMMGSMFQTIQQEHAAIVRDLVSQLGTRAEAIPDRKTDEADIPFAEPIYDGVAPSPANRYVLPEETEVLTDAHTWFTDRLARMRSAAR